MESSVSESLQPAEPLEDGKSEGFFSRARRFVSRHKVGLAFGTLALASGVVSAFLFLASRKDGEPQFDCGALGGFDALASAACLPNSESRTHQSEAYACRADQPAAPTVQDVLQQVGEDRIIDVRSFVRTLPQGYHHSEANQALAEQYGIALEGGQSYINAHQRTLHAF